MRIQRNQNQEKSSAFEHFASIISILLLPLISCQLVAFKCARAHVLLPLAGLVVREISRAFKLVNLSNGNIYRRFNFTCNTNIITYLLAHTHKHSPGNFQTNWIFLALSRSVQSIYEPLSPACMSQENMMETRRQQSNSLTAENQVRHYQCKTEFLPPPSSNN